MLKTKTLPLILAMLALTSCSFIGTPQQVQTVTAPPNLTDPCDDPVVLEDDSMKALGNAAINNATALIDCSAKQRGLSQWLAMPQ